jgi:cell division septum initiation protein DivIVA
VTSPDALEVEQVLDHLVDLVETARAMPMSSSCVVNRTELLNLLDEARALLPDEVSRARQVLEERAALAAQGRAEADRLVARAEVEAERLLEATAVWRRAQVEADRLLEQATDQAEKMRRETDEYVDRKLAGFELVLGQTLALVEKGRTRLARVEPGEPVPDEGDSDEQAPGGR